MIKALGSRRIARVVGVGCMLGLLAAFTTSVRGADLIWSGNNLTDGNPGTWDTTNAHWSTVTGGPYTTVWSNSPVNNAILQGTPGTITTGAAITVGTITINTALGSTTNSWVLGNSTTSTTNKITFSGANAGINANYTSGTSFLRNAAQGTLTKTGTGRVELDNTGMGITQYFINAGSLTMPNVTRLGTAPASLVSNFFTFNGGGLGFNTTTSGMDLGATRGITVMSGGAFLSTSAVTVTMTLSAPIVGNSGGNVTLGGNPSVWAGSGHTSGSTWTITNTNNSWDGGLILNGASGNQVKLGASGVIPDTAVVTLSASGNVFDLNGFDETIKSISGTAGTFALGTHTLTVANPNGETYSSVLTASTGGKFVKNGTGALTLSGSSTGFNGEFVLNAGTLGVGGSNIFGNSSNTSKVTINGGVLSNTSGSGRTIASSITVNLSGDFGADDSLFNSSAPGQILFNGGSTINGTAGDRTITVNGTANLGFGGAIGQDVAGRGIIKNGTGTLALTAVNTYSGNTKINAGTVNLNGTSTLGDGTGNLILNGGTLNETASRSGSGSIVTNAVQVTANSSITSSSTAATPIFEFSGALTGSGGKTLTFQDNAAAATLFKPRFSGSFTMDSDISLLTGTGAGAATVQLESFNPTGTTQTFTGVISGGGSFNRSVSSGTGGETVFSGANTYSGGTTINSGTLTVTNATGSGTGTGTVALNSATASTLNVGNGGTGGAVSGNITDNGTVNFNRSDNTSYGSPTVAISGTGVVNKKGAGTLSLPNANSYQGGTTQFDGGLNLGDKSSLGTGTYTIGDATTSTTLTVASSTALTGANAVGNAVTVAKDFTVASGSSDLELSGAINLGASNRTVTVSSSNATTFSGIIGDGGSGTGGLTKSGTGVLTLTGANTYGTTGQLGTTVSQGTLLVNNAGGSATGNGDVLVTNGSTLGGSGTIAGKVTVSNGNLSPGNSPGTINTGALTFGGTGSSLTYQMETANALADLVNAAGDLLINPGTILNASDVPSAVVALGTKYTIISYSGIWQAGTFNLNVFAGHPNGSSFALGSNKWLISYADTPTGSVNGGAYAHAVTLTAVPEASAFIIVGLGGLFSLAGVWLGKRLGINPLKA